MLNKAFTITTSSGTWVVRAGGAIIAESNAVLIVSEGGMDDVVYFPREDVGMAFLEQSDHSTTCVHKGDASYFNIVTKSRVLENAGWSYETPLEDAATLAGHIAFYKSDTVTVEQV